MSKFIGVIVGGLEIAVGAILEFVPGGQFIGGLLISAGIGAVFNGVGTLLGSSGGGQNIQQGIATAVRNPISPWVVLYGRSVACGTVVELTEK